MSVEAVDGEAAPRLVPSMMTSLEIVARVAGRSLLVLDTAAENAAGLYTRLGCVRAGAIPHYARDPAGVLESTLTFYRPLP